MSLSAAVDGIKYSTFASAVATDAYAYDDAGQLAVQTQSVAGHPAGMRTLTHSYDDADGLRTGIRARRTGSAQNGDGRRGVVCKSVRKLTSSALHEHLKSS